MLNKLQILFFYCNCSNMKFYYFLQNCLIFIILFAEIFNASIQDQELCSYKEQLKSWLKLSNA